LLFSFENSGFNLSDIYIGNLRISAVTLDEDVAISQVYDLLKRDESAQEICVTKDGIVQCVLTRGSLKCTVGGMYGYNMYSRKDI